VRSYHWLSLTKSLRWRLAVADGAGPGGSESWSLIVGESVQLRPGEIPVGWIRWVQVGQVSVDRAQLSRPAGQGRDLSSELKAQE
jgi:hypothetical protein